MGPSVHQPTITAFLDRHKRKVSRKSSRFAHCPICQSTSIPRHRLAQHASECNGRSARIRQKTKRNFLQPTHEPIPGLLLFEDFITMEEECRIMAELDSIEQLPWKRSSFNGQHHGKRWGVHCNLRERKVTPPDNPLPPCLTDLVIPRLMRQIEALTISSITAAPWNPNEANAIDYCQAEGDYLKSHVDDRKLSKEPIANLSLAGDCIMTFTTVKPNISPHTSHRVRLPRRCLQVLTGPARYSYAHGIAVQDILSPRRVSITMRESPLTAATTNPGLDSKARPST